MMVFRSEEADLAFLALLPGFGRRARMVRLVFFAVFFVAVFLAIEIPFEGGPGSSPFRSWGAVAARRSSL